MMESESVKNPKDGQITNRDISVTNKDEQNIREKGAETLSKMESEELPDDAVIEGKANSERFVADDESSDTLQSPAAEN